MTDKKKSYDSLKKLTGHNAGGILFPDDSVWVGNWSQVDPQILPGSYTAAAADVPPSVQRAMIQHDLDNGGWGPTEGYHAWAVGALVVVIQDDWN